jgi:hypothetical protein
MKNFKIQVKKYNPEKNEYTADKTYIVQRSPRNELDTIVELQKEILYKFIESSASAGELIRDNDTWNTLKTLASNLNILGKKERGFDLEEISDDLEQICQIFMTQSMKDDGTFEETETEDGKRVLWKSSLVSELHQLNFDFYWQESRKKMMEKQLQEVEKKS